MKLIDFGLSAFLNPGKKLRVHCGSPSYAAPEIISRKVRPPILTVIGLAVHRCSKRARNEADKQNEVSPPLL
eukprot:5509263-Pyramimonas_sp.AAC.1